MSTEEVKKIREELNIENTVREDELDEMEKWFKDHGPSDEEIEAGVFLTELSEQEEKEIALCQEEYNNLYLDENEINNSISVER